MSIAVSICSEAFCWRADRTVLIRAIVAAANTVPPIRSTVATTRAVTRRLEIKAIPNVLDVRYVSLSVPAVGPPGGCPNRQ